MRRCTFWRGFPIPHRRYCSDASASFAPLLVEVNNRPGKTSLLADIVAICVGVEGLQIGESQGGDEVAGVVVHGCLLTGLPFWGDTKVGGKGCFVLNRA